MSEAGILRLGSGAARSTVLLVGTGQVSTCQWRPLERTVSVCSCPLNDVADAHRYQANSIPPTELIHLPLLLSVE